jgi:hypothetical protein
MLTDLTRIEEQVTGHFAGYGGAHGQAVCLATDATGIGDTGAEGGAGYTFVFGLLPLDPGISDLWLHVTPAQTGGHGQVRAVEAVIFTALERLGVHVMIHATDGDHDLDEAHYQAFESYRGFPHDMFLGEIVTALWEQGGTDGRAVFTRWPSSDFFHQLKNERQRIRNRPVLASADRPPVTAAVMHEAVGMPSIAYPGTSGSMSDALALQTFQVAGALALIEVDMQDAAAFIAPWAIAQLAICGEGISRGARRQALSVSYAMFRRLHSMLPLIPARQRGAAGMTVTFADANQLRRVMNGIVVVYALLAYRPGPIALGRTGSHSVETHFGMTRSFLCGQSQWRHWLSAEAFARMLPRIRERIGLNHGVSGRRGRAMRAGALVPAVDGEGDFQPVAIEEVVLLRAAQSFISDQSEANEEARPFVDYLIELVSGVAQYVPPTPGPWEGGGSAWRQFHPSRPGQ